MAVISVLGCTSAAPADNGLPVLFQFQQPTHNVAVFRGADLKKAFAAGVVKGFGATGVAAPAVAPVVRVAPRPAVVPAPVVRVAPAPVVRVAPVVRPAPVVVRPAPVVVKTAPVVGPAPVLAPAPVVTHKAVHSAPVVSAYAPAPKVAYKPYVDEYADEPAVYTYEYAVKDDYSNNDFGAAESRDNYLTTGRYVVALPGKHI